MDGLEPRVWCVVSVKKVSPGILCGGAGFNEADEVGKALIPDHVEGGRCLEGAAHGVVGEHMMGVLVFVLSHYGAVGEHDGMIEHLMFAATE